MAARKVVLFGAAKLAQLCRFFLTHDSPYEVVAFTVDGACLDGDERWGLPLVPFEEIERRYPPGEYAMFIATGYQKLNRLRAGKYAEARAKGYELISYVSSRCVTWGEVAIGDNCFIQENSVLYPWTTIGSNVIIRSSAFIGHDVTIGDHCWISSHAAVNGSVVVEPHCFIGAGAIVRNGVTVRRDGLIGAGAVILSDTQENSVYIARPAERYPVDSARFVQMTDI